MTTQDDTDPDGQLDRLVPGRLPSRRADLVAARLSLEAALPSRLIDDHAAGGSLAIVIEVPSAAWCGPIGEALSHRFTQMPEAGRLRIISRSTKPSPADVDTVVSGLADGRTIVGIGPDPRRCLPSALIHAADAWITIPHVKGDALAAVLTEVTGQAVIPDALSGLDDFDLSEIGTAVRRGSSLGACIVRLRTIQARRAEVVDDCTPPLGQMFGYGAAADWGLALARDIDRLRNGDARITLADLPRGILCYGPPGVGKTLYAKSLAKSCRVPLTVTSASEWLSAGDGHLDDALKAARAAVEAARASGLPALLFIDEVDSLINRSHEKGRYAAWWVNFVNGILTLIDGATTTPGLITVGACNHPELVDPALRRSGRLDISIEVPLPDVEAREGILRHHLRGDLAEADLDLITLMTEGRSGADLARFVREARQRARDAGRDLVLDDLLATILPPDPRTAAELRSSALHEAGHAVVADVLGSTVLTVSLAFADGFGGSTHVRPGSDAPPTRSEIEREVIGILAGRATDLVLGRGATAGAGGSPRSDLALATRTLASLHGSLGLGETLLYRGTADAVVDQLHLNATIQTVIEADLQCLLGQAIAIVRANAPAIHAVADALMKQRLLTGDDVKAIRAANPPAGTRDPAASIPVDNRGRY